MKKEDNTQYVTFHMKPPKYMVGDLVYIDNKTRKITAINDSGQYHIKVEDGTAIVKPKEVVPIPLTPEILEKNGWKKVFPNENLWKKGSIIIYDCLKEHNFWCFKITGFDEGDIYFNFVHQLQHLIFGLGLDNSMTI